MTIEEKVHLVVVCPHCRNVQVFRSTVDVPPTKCGKIFHCFSNNRHKVFETESNFTIQCGICDDKFKKIPKVTQPTS